MPDSRNPGRSGYNPTYEIGRGAVAEDKLVALPAHPADQPEQAKRRAQDIENGTAGAQGQRGCEILAGHGAVYGLLQVFQQGRFDNEGIGGVVAADIRADRIFTRE